jgi:DNA-binding IscR family transcriptional regulator
MAPEKCTHNADCTARGIWQKLNDGIRELMRNITFEQILEEYRNGTAKDGVFDYCI